MIAGTPQRSNARASVPRVRSIDQLGHGDDARAASFSPLPPRDLSRHAETSSAPAATACRISAASNVSMLTRMPAPTRSRTTSPSPSTRPQGAAMSDDIGAGFAKGLGAATHRRGGSSRRVVISAGFDVLGAVVVGWRLARPKTPGSHARPSSFAHRDAGGGARPRPCRLAQTGIRTGPPGAAPTGSATSTRWSSARPL